MNVHPHLAQNTSCQRSAIDRRTPRHPGYGMSQNIRKRIEEGIVFPAIDAPRPQFVTSL